MIRESSLLLKNNRVTPDQFLDRIVHIFTKKSDEISSNLMSESESSSENGEEALAELSLSEQPVQETPLKGMCISCRSSQCDIILTPCFDIVVCSKCWNDIVNEHVKQSEMTFKNNKRRLALEKKKVPCPSCRNIVKDAREFHMATISS